MFGTIGSCWLGFGSSQSPELFRRDSHDAGFARSDRRSPSSKSPTWCQTGGADGRGDADGAQVVLNGQIEPALVRVLRGGVVRRGLPVGSLPAPSGQKTGGHQEASVTEPFSGLRTVRSGLEHLPVGLGLCRGIGRAAFTRRLERLSILHFHPARDERKCFGRANRTPVLIVNLLTIEAKSCIGKLHKIDYRSVA